jgi:hypothetical protein
VIALGCGATLTALGATGCSPEKADDSPTPLWAYLAEFTERGTAEQDRARTEQADQVAACMHEQGFEYVPDPESLWSSELVEAEQHDDAWVTDHGYGLVDAAGSTSGATDTPGPNQEIVAGLSSAEREAYDQALQGPDGDGTTGCLGLASTTAPAWFEDPVYQEVLAAASALGEQAEQDPAVVAAVAAWRECMATAGQPGYDDPEDALTAMSTRVSAAEINGPGTVPAAKRAGLHADEVALAVADTTCARSTGLDEARRTARTALEATYVEEHRAGLDAWLESAATTGGADR